MGNDSREYRFQVESGADYLADFAERFELAYRACQFVGPLIQFFEQAHVLNGDHRLVSESFKQFDLRRRERAHLGAPCDQPPITSCCWRRGAAKKVRKLPSGSSLKIHLGLVQDIGNVERAMIESPGLPGSSILISRRATGIGPK